MPPKLGIVAGGGMLPGYLARTALSQGREVFVLALERHADPAVVEPFPHVWLRLGAAGKALEAFRDAGVEEVVLAGSVRRPSLAEIRPDARAARFLMRGVLGRGDDSVLGAIVEALEKEEGLRVVGVDGIAGGFLAAEGLVSARAPTEEEQADIQRGIDVLRTTGAADVGQSVVIQQGLVLGIEAIEGTDGLIRRTQALQREGPQPVLVKMAKPGQERRVDLPTIGPDTIAACRESGLAGLAVEAGNCLVVERKAVVQMVDDGGLFLIGLAVPEA
ncbi:MAG: UDP-2,3-diacylglucosamine diphosphatase LpxI [Rhodospirillales bacterium]|nr:UDP-2,3-diacylglucosamine diphosphatase LpxI [Rhodospirillales bacterium]